MANLNLSEFTEKLFVADADHTFIWDSTVSISKRVSRNSWLNSGTLTSDAPVTISQTWATTGIYTAVKINVTETATANTISKFLDLQLGGASRFSVEKDRVNLGTQGYYSNSGNSPRLCSTSGLPLYLAAGGDVAAIGLTVKPDLSVQIGGYSDGCRFYKDGNHQLGLRDGTAAQTFNVYGTYTSGTSYERLTLSAPSAANAIIGTNKGSGGGTARGLDLHTDGAARITITTAGNVGIGTTAPAVKLDVAGDAAARGFLYLDRTGGNLTQMLYLRARNAGNSSAFGNATGFGGGEILTTGLSGLAIGTVDSTPIVLGTGNLERVRIDSVGNVGIGTTSPTSKLQVSAGDVEVDTIAKGVILKSPDGTRYRVTVANGGTLSVAAV